MAFKTEEGPPQVQYTGYRSSLGNLIGQYQQALYYLCLRLVGNHEDAADLVQHTFLQAIEKLDGFRGCASFRTWLYAIAVNLCRNFLRHKAVRLRALSNLGATQAWVPGDPLENDELRGQVQAGLDQLPEKQRMAVILRIYEELSYRDIGQILNCREATARSHVHHGLKSLAIKLQPLQE